jgi:hypothetical protein
MSPVLDTAIGLVFVYLLLSLACSAAKELVELIVKKRATHLNLGLLRLLGSDDWLKKVYAHPLIYGLCKYDGIWPSYIPSATFAKALVDLVRTHAGPAPANTPPATDPFQELRATVERMPDTPIKSALLAVFGTTTRSLDAVQADIENWFNGAMERVSGWYKRWSQYWILAIGAVLTIAINVDTIAIGRSLWRDPALREAVVAAATEQLKPKLPPPGQPPKPEEPEATMKRLKQSSARLAEFGMPVGWDAQDPRVIPNNVNDGLLKFVGWLVTALAVSLGAPFWFDILNKVVTVRSAMKPK